MVMARLASAADLLSLHLISSVMFLRESRRGSWGQTIGESGQTKGIGEGVEWRGENRSRENRWPRLSTVPHRKIEKKTIQLWGFYL
jgi:hypothetical protein